MRQYSLKILRTEPAEIVPENNPVTVQNVGSSSVRVFFDEGTGLGFILMPYDFIKANCSLLKVSTPLESADITVLEGEADVY